METNHKMDHREDINSFLLLFFVLCNECFILYYDKTAIEITLLLQLWEYYVKMLTY